MKLLQKKYNLYYLGYLNCSIPKVNSNEFIKAVKSFQKSHNLVVDGSYGPKTEACMKKIIKDIQKRLNMSMKLYLKIDGYIGSKTINAIYKFQEKYNLNKDNICGNITYHKLIEVTICWKEIKNITSDELLCRCGKCSKQVKPNIMLGYVMQLAREYFNKPINNSCGVRCPYHNNIVNGDKDSYHLTGHAADVCIPGISSNNLYKFFKSLPKNYINYTYKIDKNYVHIQIPR